MSEKDAMYGVVTAVVPGCNGLDGEPYTGYIINHNWGVSPIIACPVKPDETYSVGEVVKVIQCGQLGVNGNEIDPLHGYGIMKYATTTYPQVLEVASQGLKLSLIDNPRYKATMAMTWLCNKADKKGRYYWAGTVTAKNSNTIVVAPQAGISYEVPVDTDLTVNYFSIGDYVLVHSISLDTKCIGWWQMEQGAGAIITGTLSFTDMQIYPGDGGVLVLRLENISNKTAQDITVTFSNTTGAFTAALDGTTWHVGSMAPGEVQTHYINVVFKGIWPTVSGYAVNISVTDTSPKTTYIGATTLPFSIRQASFVFDWDCFSPCRVHAPSGVSTGYVSILHRDTGGGIWKTFAVAYLQYDFPPIGIFFELELDAYYGFEYGTAHVLSQGDGKNFKVVFEVSVNYITPHKFPTFDINVTSNILVINGFELLDEPPTEY